MKVTWQKNQILQSMNVPKQNSYSIYQCWIWSWWTPRLNCRPRNYQRPSLRKFWKMYLPELQIKSLWSVQIKLGYTVFFFVNFQYYVKQFKWFDFIKMYNGILESMKIIIKDWTHFYLTLHYIKICKSIWVRSHIIQLSAKYKIMGKTSTKIKVLEKIKFDWIICLMLPVCSEVKR